MTLRLAGTFWLLSLCLNVVGLAQNRTIPPPLRVFIPFEAAWGMMQEVLQERELPIALENRGQGFIVSEYREFISGPLTDSHIRKIGEYQRLPDGSYLRVQYQYEILIELISERDTIVTANANVMALTRSFLGEQKWVEVQSNGSLEEGLLTEFGKKLFGEAFRLDQPRRGFWQRDPTYLPDMSERIPRIAGPERP